MDSQATLHASRPLKEPTVKELLNLVRVSDPHRLGLELNLGESSLKIVEVDHPTDHGKQLLDVFGLYVTQTVEPSWLQVVAALRAMGENRLAKKLIDKFQIYERVSPTSTSLTRRHINLDTHTATGPENGDQSPGPGRRLTQQPENPAFCSLKVLIGVLLAAGAITVVLVIFVGSEQFYSTIFHLRGQQPNAPDPVKISSSKNTKPVTPPLTPGKDEEWLSMEPTIKLLSLIKYTDSEGEEQTFRLITDVQNKCPDLGTELGIDPATLTGIRSSLGSPSYVCKEILETWIDRGVDVTWGRLLQALHDMQLGRIEKHLREALSHP